MDFLRVDFAWALCFGFALALPAGLTGMLLLGFRRGLPTDVVGAVLAGCARLWPVDLAAAVLRVELACALRFGFALALRDCLAWPLLDGFTGGMGTGCLSSLLRAPGSP